ncbi:MAG: hypothetical protein NZL93_07135, partial [Chthoniobacterales bacterium]|nr:hypothetical protein [Chthoniobacterales bacterium]
MAEEGAAGGTWPVCFAVVRFAVFDFDVVEGDAVVTRGEDITWEEKRDLALRDLLVRRGERVIGFDEYLDIVLYNPEWGYYASGNAKIGWEGADFFTNCSVGPIFAEA